MTTLSHNCSIF